MDLLAENCCSLEFRESFYEQPRKIVILCASNQFSWFASGFPWWYIYIYIIYIYIYIIYIYILFIYIYIIFIYIYIYIIYIHPSLLLFGKCMLFAMFPPICKGCLNFPNEGKRSLSHGCSPTVWLMTPWFQRKFAYENPKKKPLRFSLKSSNPMHMAQILCIFMLFYAEKKTCFMHLFFG